MHLRCKTKACGCCMVEHVLLFHICFYRRGSEDVLLRDIRLYKRGNRILQVLNVILSGEGFPETHEVSFGGSRGEP